MITPSYEAYAKLRNDMGMTDADVSRKTGIATASLSDWKQGKSKPKADKLLILARLFEVTIESFMEEK